MASRARCRRESACGPARDVGCALSIVSGPGRFAPLVGDVRGSGLFLGVELVKNRETLAPATAEASEVVNRMRDRGILLGTDGPFHNVIKIRPPMPFTREDGEHFGQVLDEILREL